MKDAIEMFIITIAVGLGVAVVLPIVIFTLNATKRFIQ